MFTQIDQGQILRDELRNIGIMWRNDLGSILPVQLVPIVILGIMRSSHHDSSKTLVSEDSKWDHGSAYNLVIKKDFDAKVFEHSGREMSESLREVPSVVPYGDSLFLALLLSKLL